MYPLSYCHHILFISLSYLVFGHQLAKYHVKTLAYYVSSGVQLKSQVTRVGHLIDFTYQTIKKSGKICRYKILQNVAGLPQSPSVTYFRPAKLCAASSLHHKRGKPPFALLAWY